MEDEVMSMGAPGQSSNAEAGPTPVKSDESGGATADAANPVKEEMLRRVAQSDAHFKHQQRGDPELTFDEKTEIALNLLSEKPILFLSRFGSYLEEDDLSYFACMSDQYEVDFYLKDIKRRLDDRRNHQVIRNRRYEAMKKLMMDGEYFGDEAMKERDPLLYEQLVGQFLSDDEIKEQADKVECKISEVFLQHLQGMDNSELYYKMKDIEESQMEESDEDEEEKEEEDIKDVDGHADDEDKEQAGEEGIPYGEKLMLRNEFVRVMQQRFLDGEDKGFDYKEVDNNVEYDSLDIRAQDEEEKYFDAEDSDTISSMGSASYQKPVQDMEEVEDYEMYEVIEDVRPGLEPQVSQAAEKTLDKKDLEMEEDVVAQCQKKCNIKDDT